MIASFLLCDTSLLGYKVGLKWFVIVVSTFCSRSIKYTNVIGVSWHIGVGVSWTESHLMILMYIVHFVKLTFFDAVHCYLYETGMLTENLKMVTIMSLKVSIKNKNRQEL